MKTHTAARLVFSLSFCLALHQSQATSVVLNAGDSGPGSLRQTITDAISGETIIFTNTLAGQTIILTSGQLLVDEDLTIDASALTGGIAIDGNGPAMTNRVMEITYSATLVLNSLTITNGHTPNGLTGENGENGGYGGGIFNHGDLTLIGCTPMRVVKRVDRIL